MNELFAFIRDNHHEGLHDALSADNSNVNSYAVVVPLELGRWIEETPLHFAAYCGSMECVQVLLASGADPALPIKDEGSFSGLTAAQLARKYGYDNLAEAIESSSRNTEPRKPPSFPTRVIQSAKARRFAPRTSYAEARKQVPLFVREEMELQKALTEQTEKVERLSRENKLLQDMLVQRELEIQQLLSELGPKKSQ